MIRGQADIETFIAVNHAALSIYLNEAELAGELPKCVGDAVNLYDLD